MANVINRIDVEVNGLSSGVDQLLPNQAAIWRKARPQPFNVVSPESPIPTSGQIWPRGTAQG